MGAPLPLHWLVILIIVVVPLAIIVKVISRTKRTTSPSAEARLQELRRLRGAGLITDAEYEERRSAVLRDI